MQPSWREINRILGFILLFGVLSYNLYVGSTIWESIFRALLVYLIFGIIITITTAFLSKILHQYEMKRMKELLEEAESERIERVQEHEREVRRKEIV